MRFCHTDRTNRRIIFGALDFPRKYWCSSLSAPLPLPPFPVQPYLSRYPTYQREIVFVVAPLALSPSVPPGPGPVDLLNAVRAPFHVHPPHSVAMLVVRSHTNPSRAFCGDQWSVGESAPRARTTGPDYRTCKPRDRVEIYEYTSLKAYINPTTVMIRFHKIINLYRSPSCFRCIWR